MRAPRIAIIDIIDNVNFAVSNIINIFYKEIFHSRFTLNQNCDLLISYNTIERMRREYENKEFQLKYEFLSYPDYNKIKISDSFKYIYYNSEDYQGYKIIFMNSNSFFQLFNQMLLYYVIENNRIQLKKNYMIEHLIIKK